MEWARTQPGGLRRRRVSSTSENGNFVAGDLDPWEDAPFLEGASRRWGPSTKDESEAWLHGSGRLPNGLESVSSWRGFELRSRWRDDRRKTENATSAAMEAGWSGFHAGLRAERPDGGKCAVAGWRDGSWNLSALATGEGPKGARLAGSSASTGLRGELRWVSGAVRHGGLPSGWSGATAARLSWKNPAASDMIDGIRLEAERRDELDRILAQLGWTPIRSPLEISTRPATTWRSRETPHGSVVVRVGRSDPGPWKPSLEGTWSDSAAGMGLSGGAQLAWSSGGRRSAAGALSRPGSPVQVFAEQTGSVRSGRHSAEVSIRLRAFWAADPRVRAEGGLSCAW